MLGLVFLSFLCCFGPGMLIKTMDRCYKYPALHIACYILNWCTVVVNPTVYFFRNEKYKELEMRRDKREFKPFKLFILQAMIHHLLKNNQVVNK
ncbi:protein trapped in endoderm-1 isoform X2 [Eurytemora carolleeae]|uniref:protein trapped in endoderm-1 isoform X2 n=1 Tax=Eurytemora carolleeae TaxID=1294199 RepID=UPI000C75BF37|nr:protein trapped in endoderm-1 isoform X2 [Eurytemora carolleeae]|eukprot:XP_023336862.1 protein trapped in endoderm-1-like isoform X2 [Eurytemora affinis]